MTSFAYCENDPVNFVDTTGNILISTCVLVGFVIGTLVGAGIGSTYGYKLAKKMNIPEKNRWKFVVGYGIGGAVIGGVIGSVLGYGIGVAIGATSSSGIAINAISKAISAINRNKINHIMQSKHAWNLVFKKASWSNVKNLINTVLKKGTMTLIDKQGKSLVYEAVYNYAGKKIIVRYAVIDGIIKIADAWVKTR